MQTAARLASHERWRFNSITLNPNRHKAQFVGTLKIRVFASVASRPMPPALLHMLLAALLGHTTACYIAALRRDRLHCLDVCMNVT